MERLSRGDVVLVPFPFVAAGAIRQKLRPALIISDPQIQSRYSDVTLIAITSQIPQTLQPTEVLVDPLSPDFALTGLAKASVVKVEMLMTIPEEFIRRKIGSFGPRLLRQVERALTLYLGLTIA